MSAPQKLGNTTFHGLDAVRLANRTFETVSAAGRQPIAEARSLEEEVAMALGGGAGFSERFGDQAERLLSVTMPITKVARVVGAPPVVVLPVLAEPLLQIVRPGAGRLNRAA